MEKELSLKLLQNVISATKDAIVITGPLPDDGSAPKIVYVNEAFTNMTGYSQEFAIGNTAHFLQGPNTDREELSKLRKSLRKGESYETTLINYKKNGEEFWNNFTISPVVNENGECTNWIGIERDVTRQKNDELAKELLAKISRDFSIENDLLEAANKLCKTIVDFGRFDCVELWTRDLKENKLGLFSHFVKDNKDEQFYRLSKSTTTFKRSAGLPGIVWEKKEQVFWGEEKMAKDFIRIEAADKIGLKAVFGVPLLYNDQVKGVLLIGTRRDLNYLKKFSRAFSKIEKFLGDEIRRKKVEHKLTLLFQSIPDILCLTDWEGNILKINRAGCELLGYKESELLQRPLNEFFVNIENNDFQLLFDQIKKGEKHAKLENQILNKYGELVWLSWSCNASKEYGYIYVTAKNITAEKELAQLTEQATSLAKIGSWEFDLINQQLYWSEMVHQLHETDSDSFEPSVEDALNFYHSDYRELITLAFERCIREGKSFDIEAIIITSKSKKRWIRVIGNAEFLNNECRRVYGSFQDIDDRKIASEKLRKAYVEKNSILESIGEAFFTINHEDKVTYWNKQAKNVFGMLPREVLNNNLWEANQHFKNTEFSKRCKESLKTRTSASFEEYFEAYEKWFEISIFPSEDGLSIYFQDITRRKESELEILAANERFEKVSEATTDAIWDWDVQENNLYWGNSYKKLFGYDIQQLRPSLESWTKHIHPDDLNQITLSLREKIKGQDSSWEEEYRYERIDGTYATVVDKGLIMRDKKGNAVRMIGAMSDISERKKYEEQLVLLNNNLSIYTKELEQKNKDLDSFAFITSHDLQEPLRMVSSFMDLLEKKYSDQLDDRAQKYIHFAKEGAKRMKNMILDLLEYSRTSRLDMKTENFQVREIIENFQLLRKKSIAEKSVHIEYDNLPEIKSSKAAITQIFHCLLDNAIKYAKRDVPPVITINTKEDKEYWILSITDNGIGIAPEFHEKIFTVFYRLHSQNEFGGTGIGLSIVKRIIENIKGDISLISSPGKGTTFTIKIPKNLNQLKTLDNNFLELNT